MRPLARLIGARIRRIDAPHEELLSLSFAGREDRGVLVFCWASGASGVGIVSERPHGLAADSFIQKLRKELEGGKIGAFAQPSENTLELDIERSGGRRQLLCHFGAPQIALFGDEAQLLAHRAIDRPRLGRVPRVIWPETLDELEARGPALLVGRATAAIDQRRSQLDKLLRSGVRRLERRLEALAEEIARAAEAEPLRARANLLLVNLHAVKRGATSVRLIDFTIDPPTEVDIALDPARIPRDQVEAWFKQARRYERGAAMAAQRTAATDQQIARLLALRSQLMAADGAELDWIGVAARELGVRGASQPGPRKDPARQRH
ncbi:MAG TPA: NFACT family protein, partial [Polyangiales bacterium]